MTTQNTNSPTEANISTDSQENVIGSIVVKTIATLAIGLIAWYFLQNMI